MPHEPCLHTHTPLVPLCSTHVGQDPPPLCHPTLVCKQGRQSGTRKVRPSPSFGPHPQWLAHMAGSAEPHMLRFHWTLDLHHFFLSYLPVSRSPLPLITRRLHRTASSLSLISYHLYCQLPLVLSSGWPLIALSLWLLLSCTIHRLTKQGYCRPWTMSPSSLYSTRSRLSSSI